MATKTELISKVNTDLASGQPIAASDHRGVLHGSSDSIIDNFYADVINDNNASTNVVTEAASDKPYALNFTKQGRTVHVEGFVRNATGSITSPNEIWCNITNTEFQQTTGAKYISGRSDSTGESILFTLATNSFAALQTVGINEVLRFNFYYNTNA